MASFTPGSGGPFSGINNLEDWTVAHINLLRILQANPDRNPNSIRNLVITANSEGAISGSFNCPVTVGGGAAGAVTITASSYLTGATYTAPSGGEATATNEVQALIDAVRRQKARELAGSTANPTNANYLSFSVAMGTTGVGTTNATVNIGFAGLPVDMVQNTNGTITIEGRTYLN
jgi:hypothetical protein